MMYIVQKERAIHTTCNVVKTSLLFMDYIKTSEMSVDCHYGTPYAEE